MGKVLLTGGSGFIAAHVLKTLLDHEHTVVTTVRSRAKGDQILAQHPDATGRLSYEIVGDIAAEGAFDEAVKSDPPFDYVVHTASPFHNDFTDPVEGLLNPAIKGTTGILRAIKALAPSVKRVVVTSSFAAIINPEAHKEVYDETSWNPVTWDQAVEQRSATYRGSKTFAEKAAWDFIENEKPNFDLATVNPPLVFGPIAHHLTDLGALNTSNLLVRDIIQGKPVPPTGAFLFTDVRDLALAHVRAMERPEAGGKRFFVTAGKYSNKQVEDAIRETIRKTRPEIEEKLAGGAVDDLERCVYGYDNSRVRKVLDIQFRSLKESVGDTATSLLELGASG